MKRLVRVGWRFTFTQAICTAGVLALAACGPSDAPPPKPPTVTVAKPIRKTVTDWDEFTGRFEATDQVDIRARVSGYLQTIAFKDGSMVKKGDLLFIIDLTLTSIALLPQIISWIYSDRSENRVRAVNMWILFTLAAIASWVLASGVGFPFHVWVLVLAILVLTYLFTSSTLAVVFVLLVALIAIPALAVVLLERNSK